MLSNLLQHFLLFLFVRFIDDWSGSCQNCILLARYRLREDLTVIPMNSANLKSSHRCNLHTYQPGFVPTHFGLPVRVAGQGIWQ